MATAFPPHEISPLSAAAPPQSGWRLLATRDFGLLWAGQSVSQIGDGMNKVALLWFVYTLTGSAFKMTVIGLLQTLPPLVLGPLIGVYLDRLPKKPVMIGIDLIQAGLILLVPVLYSLNALSLEGLYLLVFLIAVFGTVFGPALASAVPLIVERSQLTPANALIQSTTNIGVLAGPALSGLGIALIGAQNVLYIDAACNLVSALFLMPVRVREVLARGGLGPARPTVVGDLLAGFRFVFIQQRLVLSLMVTTALYTVAASAFTFLLPVYAKEHLQAGPVELGWLWSALGVGMLATTLWLVWLQDRPLAARFRILARSMVIGGLAVCGLTLLHSPLGAAGLITVIGGSNAVFMPVVWAMLQEVTPGHFRGRMFTTFSTGGMASAMAGMAGLGWTADRMGPSPSLLAVGLLLIAAAVAAQRLSRRPIAVAMTAAAVVDLPGPG